MSYAFEQEDGTVAICNLLSSVPSGANYVENPTFPEGKSQRSAWRLVDGVIVLDIDVVAELDKQQAKLVKAEALAALVVTTSNGNTFDGNETARNNMLSALKSSEFLGVTSTEWKLADNSKVIIGLNELKEALALSIQKVGVIVTGTV